MDSQMNSSATTSALIIYEATDNDFVHITTNSYNPNLPVNATTATPPEGELAEARIKIQQQTSELQAVREQVDKLLMITMNLRMELAASQNCVRHLERNLRGETSTMRGDTSARGRHRDRGAPHNVPSRNDDDFEKRIVALERCVQRLHAYLTIVMEKAIIRAQEVKDLTTMTRHNTTAITDLENQAIEIEKLMGGSSTNMKLNTRKQPEGNKIDDSEDDTLTPMDSFGNIDYQLPNTVEYSINDIP